VKNNLMISTVTAHGQAAPGELIVRKAWQPL
jgi:hypothetical protein